MMPHSGEAHRSKSKVARYSPIASEEAQNQEISGSPINLAALSRRTTRRAALRRCVVPSSQPRCRAISCSPRCEQVSLRRRRERRDQAGCRASEPSTRNPLPCFPVRDVLHAPSGPLSHFGTPIRPHEFVCKQRAFRTPASSHGDSRLLRRSS